MKEYKLVAFDLDGTLAPSKNNLTKDVSIALCELLKVAKVAVISGGSLDQFKVQFLRHLECSDKQLSNLHILPTNGAELYSYNTTWQKVYEENLTEEDKKKILSAFEKSLKEVGFVRDPKAQGEIIEDRIGQMTFSGMGQKAPLELKSKWDPDRQKRQAIVKKLKEYIPEFEIRIGGTTSIDVTKKGINKAYGIIRISEILGIKIEDGVYIGDALYENGNDAIVKTTGMETIQVSGPEETIKIIKDIIRIHNGNKSI